MIQMSRVILGLLHMLHNHLRFTAMQWAWFKSIHADGDLAGQADLNLLLLSLNECVEEYVQC